jgi:hypothetical protein
LLRGRPPLFVAYYKFVYLWALIFKIWWYFRQYIQLLNMVHIKELKKKKTYLLARRDKQLNIRGLDVHPSFLLIKSWAHKSIVYKETQFATKDINCSLFFLCPGNLHSVSVGKEITKYYNILLDGKSLLMHLIFYTTVETKA